MNARRCIRPGGVLPTWQASWILRRLPGQLPGQRTVAPVLVSRRWETSTTGDDKSGHIAAPQLGEGLLFFDNVFPLRVGNVINWRPWRSATDYSEADVSGLLKRFHGDKTQAPASSGLFSRIDAVALLKRAIPADLPITVTEIVPRLKDGGVFVKFRHPTGTAADDIEDELDLALHKHPVRPWFNPIMGSMRVGLVRGVPWLEDLASRVPSARMRIDFCAPPPRLIVEPPPPPPPVSPIEADLTTGGVEAAPATSPAPPLPPPPPPPPVAGDASGSANLELSQETIYSLFRRYGKIAEISSQPFESKTLPRYATIDFVRIRDAVLARSCLHGYVVNGATRLRLSYEPRPRAHFFWDWLTGHPRIVIPILAALLAAVTVAVFDPIRTFFIRAHVQHSFALRDSFVYKWLERRSSAAWAAVRDKFDEATGDMGLGGDDNSNRPGMRALMTHRRELIESLHTWLLETSETFIVVQGPRGSGKRELVVDQALDGRRDVLVLDCKPVVEARGESATISKLAASVGYRPVFSWANSISSLVDLAVQGTTGVKAGFSETLDEQLAKILQTAAMALRQVGLAARHKHDEDAFLGDDAYLEAHPERRPVVVLDNFGQRNEEATALVYDKLAEWAAELVQANVAHVIFLTSDTSYPKALVRALPDRVFRQVALGDLSPDVAKNYVLSHLTVADNDDDNDAQTAGETGENPTVAATVAAATAAAAAVQKATGSRLPALASAMGATQTRAAIRELDECIGVLGGRLTDLESLVRRLKSGQTPKRAVSEIVEQSAAEIIKMFLLVAKTPQTAAGRAWTPEQAWYLVREIAAQESLRYNEVLLSDLFASPAGGGDGVAALDVLAAAELITIRSARGRPQTVRAGSPVYQAAFALLRTDAALAARLDRRVLAERTAIETRVVAKAEDELALLGSLPRQPPQTADRIAFLLGKLQASQAKVAAYDAEMLRLKMLQSVEV